MAKAGTPGVRASCPTSRADEPGQGKQAMQHTKRTAHVVNLCQFLSRSLPHPSRLPDLLYTSSSKPWGANDEPEISCHFIFTHPRADQSGLSSTERLSLVYDSGQVLAASRHGSDR